MSEFRTGRTSEQPSRANQMAGSANALSLIAVLGFLTLVLLYHVAFLPLR